MNDNKSAATENEKSFMRPSRQPGTNIENRLGQTVTDSHENLKLRHLYSAFLRFLFVRQDRRGCNSKLRYLRIITQELAQTHYRVRSSSFPPLPVHIQFSVNRQIGRTRLRRYLNLHSLYPSDLPSNPGQVSKSIWKESTMSDRRINVFPEVSDNVSVMSSTVRGSAFPDIPIFACLAESPVGKSRFAADVKDFKGKLDTGATLCLLAEHVVADRFGLDRIDRSKWITVNDLGNNGVRTMGEIKLLLLMGSRTRWLEVSFQVLPDEHVQYRYDALMSDKIIKRLNILVLNPDYL